MSREAAAGGDGQLLAAYREYESRLLSRGLMVANVIGAVGMPGGVVLDYFIYPEKVAEFLSIRLIVVVLLLAIAGILFLRRNRPDLAEFKALGVISALILNGAFCLMIFRTNGALSHYYAALNLIITCWAILLPWAAAQTAITCVASLFLYVVACVANSTFSQPASFPLFAYNSFFILITTAVCVTITYFLSRARFADFGLRHQLDLQNQKLQDLDRLKTEFFSNVSHELRTPLTLILGPVEGLLARGDALDAKLHESLILIHRNSLRLLKLINDLLDLTRLDQGAEVLRKKSVTIGPYIKGIVESVRHLGLSKQLRIKVEEGDLDATMTADPARIEKVLINLLTNAIKYTPAGGSIVVRWKARDAGVALEVEDTGVGIPTQDLAKVFDRFHQVGSNASNQHQGVGIGLALARELVEEHGGKLEVESRVGIGSTFRVNLPLAASPEVEPAAAEAGAISEVEEPFEKAFRSADRSLRSHVEISDGDLPTMGRGDSVVLVADDENDMRQYVVSLLAEDYRVVQTRHGGNVGAMVEEHEPDLVLLDWMMPGKSGLEVCRELRSGGAHRDLKIVLLTARIDEKSKIEALQSGADDFLTKPFSSVEVKTRVANLLRAARLQKDLRARNGELSATVEKLQRTETMLIQSEKMNAIGSLSAGLLHEINNPLNYTLTAISVARQFRDSMGEEMNEIIADIEEGMTRIRDVITHLKNFAYPEKSDSKSLFALEEVFLGARKITAGELEGIRLDVDLPANLVVRGQKTQLTHLFINLLNNAAKALNEFPTGGSKTITVRGTAEDEVATIEVADNGVGIPPEIINRVFEPFFTTRQVGAGMGMGLSICHTIMDAHRGSIQVSNRSEGGAAFTIKIPLAAEALKPC
ncbi:MAG: ATP-binding protein [Terrimicrobiaceae bacterium]|nr:ATP-binding protein [Terrimicrobiaceae bacterium]